MYNSIKPGQVWLDSEGNRIQAHGGSVIFIDGIYYWYGENKEKTIPGSGIWHWGVRCYSSKDLYNWKNEGIIIPPNEEDLSSPIHPGKMMDRPHIIYNKMTKKFICWLKIMGEPPVHVVLSADHILGPYKVENDHLQPMGMAIGDFDLAIEPSDNKAYYIFERPHIQLVIADLTEDYLNVTGHYSEHFPHEAPPLTREAPAHFYRKGYHYLITSGTTGYHPNPSEVAMSKTWHGEYEIQGDPHVNDASRTSFNSQITSVFRHPEKKDLYIALADRWMPDLPKLEGDDFYNGKGYEKIAGKLTDVFNPETEFTFTEEDAAAININSSISDYVWLPLRFVGNRVYIDWKSEWRIEDYE